MHATPTPPAPAPPEPRPGQFVLGLVVVILLVDLILGLIPRSTGGELIEGPAAVRDEIAAATSDDRASWLLIGDSVLVGNTGEAELPDWYEHRVIDYLEREVGEHEQVAFHQVALSGLLPIDMIEIVEELDLHDPEGRVSLIVEVSPRFFSSAYAEQVEHSRPWIAELGETESSFLRPIAAALRGLRRVTPVYRHRGLLESERERLALPSLVPGFAPSVPEGEDDPGASRLEALARLRVHYRDPALDPTAAQAGALQALVEHCRAADRRVVFFATPIEDEFQTALVDDVEAGRYLADLARVIEPDGDRVVLLPMDHPLFASPLFWDHVHLRPEGQRLLAINLLAQIGLALERLPRPEDLVARVGVDTSLVAGIEQGSIDGAAWQARFSFPTGIAVSEDGRRLVVADTKNHVLRELAGDFRVVSTIAGVPGDAGSEDGSDARLRSPIAPLIVSERILFLDAGGRRLRSAADDEVETLLELEPGWPGRVLRSRGSEVLVLETRRGRDVGSRIRAIDPIEKTARVLVESGGDPSSAIVAFTSDPRGALYLATAAGQILRVPADAPGPVRSDAVGSSLELVFANTAPTYLPQAEGESFPFTFEEVRFDAIAELVWVERYGGLLVVDLAKHGRGEFGQHLTERAHLRFLDLERRLVHPWLKPLVDGLGTMYWNQNTGGFSSYFHEGSLALHQGSATLFWLERDRSRLLRLADGLLGAAKIGNLETKERLGFRDVLTSAAGERVFRDFRPDRHLDQNLAMPAMRTNHTCLLVGSSLLAISEITGQYSIGRRMAERLGFDLALRERIGLETFHRTIPGGNLAGQIKAIRTFIAAGGRPDLIIIEANTADFLDGIADEEAMSKRLDELQEQARKWSSALVILDDTPYRSLNRDALRKRPAKVATFLAQARTRGILVIDVGDAVLDAHLEVAPMGSPPFDGTHLAPWGIDLVGDRFAAALSPHVRQFLRDRVPALSATEQAPTPSRAKGLAEAFGKRARTAIAALPRVPAAAMQSAHSNEHLEILIDLGQLPPGLFDESELDTIVLAAVYDQVVRRSSGARTASIELVRFEQYDEYGLGVAEGATPVHERELDKEGLATLVRAWLEQHPE